VLPSALQESLHPHAAMIVRLLASPSGPASCRSDVAYTEEELAIMKRSEGVILKSCYQMRECPLLEQLIDAWATFIECKGRPFTPFVVEVMRGVLARIRALRTSASDTSIYLLRALAIGAVHRPFEEVTFALDLLTEYGLAVDDHRGSLLAHLIA
jgi:hypothetical protein